MSDEGIPILGPAISLAKELGILEKIALLLKPNHQAAAGKLAEVMRELEKNYEAIEKELQRFTDLSFDVSDLPRQRTKKLQDLRPLEIQSRMEAARGSCHKITNIYNTYLKAALLQILIEKDDLIQVDNLFQEMGTSDGRMLATISSMSTMFQEQVNKVEILINEGKLDAANDLIEEKSKKRVLLVLGEERTAERMCYASSGSAHFQKENIPCLLTLPYSHYGTISAVPTCS